MVEVNIGGEHNAQTGEVTQHVVDGTMYRRYLDGSLVETRAADSEEIARRDEALRLIDLNLRSSRIVKIADYLDGVYADWDGLTNTERQAALKNVFRILADVFKLERIGE